MIDLIRGDFFEKIKEVPDNSIDCIITDPPYAMTKNKWDKPLNWEEVWKEFNRVTNRDICYLFYATILCRCNFSK